MPIFLIVIVIILGLAFVEGIRVAAQRNILVSKISKKAMHDIEHHRDFAWRYAEYDKVSYHTMLLKFWKPIKSFYKDMKFLE